MKKNDSIKSVVSDITGEYTTKLKGYKQTEVGVIPEDWDVFDFGDVIHSMYLGGNYKNSLGLSGMLGNGPK